MVYLDFAVTVNSVRGSTQLDLNTTSSSVVPSSPSALTVHSPAQHQPPTTICDNTLKPVTVTLTTPLILDNANTKSLGQEVNQVVKKENELVSSLSVQKSTLISPSGATNGVVNPVRGNNITPPPSSVPRASTHMPTMPGLHYFYETDQLTGLLDHKYIFVK